MAQKATPNEIADEALLAILRLIASRGGVLTQKDLDETTDLIHRARFDDALVRQLQAGDGGSFTYVCGASTRRAAIDRLWPIALTYGIDALREEGRKRRQGEGEGDHAPHDPSARSKDAELEWRR